MNGKDQVRVLNGGECLMTGFTQQPTVANWVTGSPEEDLATVKDCLIDNIMDDIVTGQPRCNQNRQAADNSDFCPPCSPPLIFSR